MESSNKEGTAATGRLDLAGRWPREHGRRVVAAWKKSGASVGEFAQAEGLRADRLRYWRDQFELEQRSVAESRRPAKAQPISLLPVVVRREERMRPIEAQPVELVAGAQIDPAWLARFVRALFIAEARQ